MTRTTLVNEAIKHAAALVDKPAFERTSGFHIGRTLAECVAWRCGDRNGRRDCWFMYSEVIELLKPKKEDSERTTIARLGIAYGFFRQIEDFLRSAQGGGFEFTKVATNPPEMLLRAIVACYEFADGEAQGYFTPWRPAGVPLVDGKSKATKKKRRFAALNKMISDFHLQ